MKCQGSEADVDSRERTEIDAAFHSAQPCHKLTAVFFIVAMDEIPKSVCETVWNTVITDKWREHPLLGSLETQRSK